MVSVVVNRPPVSCFSAGDNAELAAAIPTTSL